MKWIPVAAAAVVAPIVVLGVAQVRSAALQEERAKVANLEAQLNARLDELMRRGPRFIPGDPGLAQADGPQQAPPSSPAQPSPVAPPALPDEPRPPLPTPRDAPDAPPDLPDSLQPELPAPATAPAPPVEPQELLPGPTVEEGPQPPRTPIVISPSLAVDPHAPMDLDSLQSPDRRSRAPSRSNDSPTVLEAAPSPQPRWRSRSTAQEGDDLPPAPGQPARTPRVEDANPFSAADAQTSPPASADGKARELALWLARADAQSAAGETLSKPGEVENWRNELRVLVTSQFIERQRKYADDVDALEARVAKLRAMIQKREAVRDRIIDQRIEQLKVEAQGMGW